MERRTRRQLFSGRSPHNEDTMTAHSRFLTSIIAVTALAASTGCVIQTTPPANPGNITFTWTFSGRQCFEVPEVVQISVQIPGQTLQNNGIYGCLNANTAGIKLLDFRPGKYSYTISGQNAAGTVIYRETGSLIVDGDVTVAVNLVPTSAATGSVYVTWTLPAGSPARPPPTPRRRDQRSHSQRTP